MNVHEFTVFDNDQGVFTGIGIAENSIEIAAACAQHRPVSLKGLTALTSQGDIGETTLFHLMREHCFQMALVTVPLEMFSNWVHVSGNGAMGIDFDDQDKGDFNSIYSGVASNSG